MRSRIGAVARECAVIVVFVLLTIVMTWPLALHLGSATSDAGDPYINTWIVSWVARTIVASPAELFDAPMFFPATDALAFSENLIGIAIFAVPLRAIGVPPLAIYNILLIAGFALSGYGAFVLARKLTRSPAAGIAAGVFFAFCLFRFNHLPHLQHVWSASIPLLLAALVHFVERTTWKSAALLGLALVWNAYANMHWLVFGSIATALTFVAIAALRARLDDRDLWTKAAGVALVAGALIWPLRFPYDAARETHGLSRSEAETAQYSAEAADWLVAPISSRTYGRLLNDGSRNPEVWLFPGFLVLLLALFAVAIARASAPALDRSLRRIPRGALPLLDAATVIAFCVWLLAIGSVRALPLPDASIAGLAAVALLLARLWIRLPASERGDGLADVVRRARVPVGVWIALLWIVLGFRGSLGVNGWLHRFLMSLSESIAGIRAPARWAIVAYTGLAILVAYAVVAIAERVRESRGVRLSSRRLEWLAGIAVSLAFLIELRAAPVRWHLRPSSEPAVYRWLARAPLKGAVLELPAGDALSDYRYLYHAATHEQPLVNGVSGFTPKHYQKLTAALHSDPIPRAVIDWLRRNGCELVVIHVDGLGADEPRVRAWLLDGLATGALHPVGWFPNDLRGDYVVSVGEPSRALVASAGSAGDAFATRAESIAAKFPLAPERPFALFHVPQTWRGAIRTEGWAAAPAGVRGVNLLFENGAVSIPAKLERRDDLKVAFPDLAYPQIAGFVAEFPKRPKDVRRETDLQVEVVDKNGKSATFGTRFMTWRPRGDIRGTEWDAAPLARLAGSLSLDPPHDIRRIVRGDITPYELARESHLLDARLTDRAFLDGIFRAVVARTPDAGTRTMFLDELRRGKKRETVLRTLFRSREFELKHLTEEAEAAAWLR